MPHKGTPTFYVLKPMKDRMPKPIEWRGDAAAAFWNWISGWVAFGPLTALHFNLTRQPRSSGC